MAFFDFLRDANTEKKAVGSAFNFLTGFLPGVQTDRAIRSRLQEETSKLERISPYLPKDQQQRIAEAQPGKDAITGARDFIVGAAREIPRSGLRIGGEIGTRLTGNEPSDYVLPAAEDPVSRLLIGGEPIESFEKMGRDVSGNRVSGKGALVLGAGLSGLDLLPGGSTGKALSKEVVEQISKEVSEQGIKKILTKEGVELSDTVVKALASTSDKNTITSIINTQTAKQASPRVIARTPQESADLAEDVRRGNISSQVDTAPIDSLRLGAGTVSDPLSEKRVAKYIGDIKTGRTLDPIIIDKDGFVQDGAHRLEAMKRTGVREVPVVETISKEPIKPGEGIVDATLGTPPQPVKTTPADQFISALKGQPAGPGQAPVKGAKALAEEQKSLYSAERAQRVAAGREAARGKTGEAALRARLGAQKGELTKVDGKALVENVQSKIDENTYQGVIDQVLNSKELSDLDQMNVANGLRKFYREGKMLQPAQLEKLDRVAPGLGDAINEVTKTTKAKTKWTDWLGLPKALKASGDVGGMFRQGIVPGARFRQAWQGGFEASVKSFGSQKAYDKYLKRLNEVTTDLGTDLTDLAKRADLDIISIKNFKEEAFPSKLAEKIPGIKNSDRSFQMGLSVQRMGIFGHIINDLEKAGKLNDISEKALKDIGKWINTATGRGDLKALGNKAPAIQEALFSAKLWKSRLDLLNPKFYKDLDPIARKYALESAASFAALAGSILGLAALAGANVETDARSSDFLKLKIGDSRYDILGGLQQNLVFAHRQLTGEKKSSTTGKVTKFGRSLSDVVLGRSDEEAGVEDSPYAGNRLTILSDLVRGKESPAIAFGQKLLEGKDAAGQPINPLTEFGKLGVPIGLESLYDTTRKKGFAEGTLRTLPEFLGISGQTYGLEDLPLSKTQKETVDKITNPEQKTAYQRFYQYQKTGPDRDSTSREIKKELEKYANSNDQQALQRATELAKKYNQDYQSTFENWRQQYSQYRNDETLVKDYRSKLITDQSFSRWLLGLKG